MSDYTFGHIENWKDEEVLKKGFYLWVWYADKIPPHIGCSIDGNYYSLKVNGKDEGLQAEKVLNIIRRKNILTLLIELNTETELRKVQEVFSGYDHARSDASTCLTPMIQLLGLEKQAVHQLAALLKYLESNHNLGKVFGLNLTEGYSGIPEYGTDDIQNRLRKLENVQIKTGIPSVR